MGIARRGFGSAVVTEQMVDAAAVVSMPRQWSLTNNTDRGQLRQQVVVFA